MSFFSKRTPKPNFETCARHDGGMVMVVISDTVPPLPRTHVPKFGFGVHGFENFVGIIKYPFGVTD